MIDGALTPEEQTELRALLLPSAMALQVAQATQQSIVMGYLTAKGAKDVEFDFTTLQVTPRAPKE